MYPNVDLHIAGAWTGGGEGQTLPILNPATGEEIGRLAVATRADLDRALEAAERGFAQWRRVSPNDRSKIMRKAATLLRERLGLDAELVPGKGGVFEVKSTAGDNHLGGDNWDKAIVDWLASESGRTHEEVYAEKAEPTDLKRLATPDEVANASVVIVAV